MGQTRADGVTRSVRDLDRISSLVAVEGRIDALPTRGREWFVPIHPELRLPPGKPTPDPSRIPQATASRLLRGFVRFVADIPAGASLELVWEQTPNELWVDAGSIDLTCAPGLVTVGLTVSCDELGRPTRVNVPFAVGRADAPRGLLMSTIDRVDAPALVADIWSDAITAFCWEAVLELAHRVSAQIGRDGSGLPLVPGGIAADKALLIIQPTARHDLSGLAR